MFFERPETGERAVLVHVDLASEAEREDPREFEELVISAGGMPMEMIVGRRPVPNAKFFIGEGKLEEIRAAIAEHGAQLVLFNHNLSPSQERNLERELQCRVLDRTGLILDIFAQRARTHEGKLQVELAQLQHMSSRLVRGWTHLDRQRGGMGNRGPGESQLESDRRMLKARLDTLRSRLATVRKQRTQGRRARKRNEVPTIALVGYTNAGKSTLFNRITQAEVFAADQLFATLDPTLRRLKLPGVGPVVFADTVGFIRHLPHKLVESFRATLEEAADADLLIHVIDACDDERLAHIEQVDAVLAEIGAEDIPRLRAYNKIDLMREVVPHVDRELDDLPVSVWLSARTGEGCELLLQAIAERLASDTASGTLLLGPDQGRLRARLFEFGAIRAEQPLDEGGWRLRVSLPRRELERLLAAAGLDISGTLAPEDF